MLDLDELHDTVLEAMSASFLDSLGTSYLVISVYNEGNRPIDSLAVDIVLLLVLNNDLA